MACGTAPTPPLERWHGKEPPFRSSPPPPQVELRLMKYYIPFHLAFGAAVVQYQPKVIVAVHSFNPVYEVRGGPGRSSAQPFVGRGCGALGQSGVVWWEGGGRGSNSCPPVFHTAPCGYDGIRVTSGTLKSGCCHRTTALWRWLPFGSFRTLVTQPG